MYWSISVSFSVYSFTFVGIFPNFPAFLEFRLEISFCISASLICLKLKRDSEETFSGQKNTLVSGNAGDEKNLHAGSRKKHFFINLIEFFK